MVLKKVLSKLFLDNVIPGFRSHNANGNIIDYFVIDKSAKFYSQIRCEQSGYMVLAKIR